MIITIAQSKGGSGKSTLAINLQYYLARYNPILVDLDSQQSIVHLNAIRSKHKAPFKVIGATSVAQLEQIYNDDSKDKLHIIDTIGADTQLTRTALLISDLIISPVSDKTIDILGLINFHKILCDLSLKASKQIKSHVVINNVSPSTKNFTELRDLIIGFNNFQLFHSVIRQRIDIPNAISSGLAVGEYNLNCKANLELKLLASEIAKLI